MEKTSYPVTVLLTRYQGLYEGGRWVALDCEPQDVPAAAMGMDLDCAKFWRDAREDLLVISDWFAESPDATSAGAGRRILHVGIGNGPSKAVDDLHARLSATALNS